MQREVAVADGKVVYLAGGLDATDTSAAGVFSLDPATGHLRALGSVLSAFHDAAGAMIAGRLFVFGGGQGLGTDLVQAFDPSTGAAAIVGHLPVALSDLSAATIGGSVYLVGGYDGRTPRREIYATTDGSHFRVVARLPVGLRYAAVVAADTTLLIAGGQAAAGMVDPVNALDTATGKITTIAHLPVPIGHAAAFVFGGMLYVVWGEDTGCHAVVSVTSIRITTGVVRRLAPLHLPVSDAGTVSGPDAAYIIGGLRGVPVDQVLIATLRSR